MRNKTAKSIGILTDIIFAVLGLTKLRDKRIHTLLK